MAEQERRALAMRRILADFQERVEAAWQGLPKL